MKKTYLLLSILCIHFSLFSQTFNVIEVDEQGDSQFSTKDLKSFQYAIDEANDSLWFKISYYDNIEGDFGLAIAFDTNQNTTDGSPWIGTNTSMTFDFIVYLSRNGVFQQNIQSSLPIVRSIVETDTNELLVNFKHSDLFKNKELNFLAGQGAFDIMASKTVFDEIPENTFMMLPADTISVGISEKKAFHLNVYPNPGKGLITLEFPNEFSENEWKVQVTTLSGKVCHEEITKSGRIDLSKLKPGSYLLVAGNESGRFAKSLLQIIE